MTGSVYVRQGPGLEYDLLGMVLSRGQTIEVVAVPACRMARHVPTSLLGVQRGNSRADYTNGTYSLSYDDTVTIDEIGLLDDARWVVPSRLQGV
jgi:hypothetical protein